MLYKVYEVTKKLYIPNTKYKFILSYEFGG